MKNRACRSPALPATLALLSACGGAPTPIRPTSAPALPPAASAPASPSAAPAASPGSDIAAKVDPIFAPLAPLAANEAHAPGCVAGVFRAGEVLFAKGYGLANLEHDLPLTPTTTLEIGSMSKQFTATAVLLLAQDGKLALGDDVRKYIPELPSYGHLITLRHLLHHTGGLREYDALLSLSGWDNADAATEEEALRLVTLKKGTNFAPGTEWSYSNTGYFLLSVVVRRVSGKTLAAFSKERIFDPLGMKDTTIFDDHTMVVRHHATGYSPRETPRDGIGFKVNMSGREMTGEGNVQTTLEDLARWDANFYEPKVGGASSPESLDVRVFAAKDGKLTIGLAVGSEATRPMEPLDARTFHGRGASSRWTFEPAAGKRPPRVTRTAPGERTMTFERFEPARLDASELAAYAGRYESPEMTSDFEVLVKDGKLQAGPWGKAHERVTLQPLARDTFAADGFGLAFERDGRRKVARMTGVFDGHRAVRWTKR